MKLRNKKTGEVIILIDHTFDNYNSLADFNEEWEDASAEPLIKDEKIRKAVRAWAEIHKIKKVYYCEYSWKNHLAWLEDGEDEVCMTGESASIDIPIIEVENKKYYTIAELCGEEEE